MAPIGNEVHTAEATDANVHVVQPADIITEDFLIKRLDLCTMAPEEQDFTAEFTLVAKAQDRASASLVAPHACHAIVLWFDTEFSARHCAEEPVMLSTSWAAPPTHWAQAVMVLKEPVFLQAAGQVRDGG